MDTITSPGRKTVYTSNWLPHYTWYGSVFCQYGNYFKRYTFIVRIRVSLYA